ncbi:MAG: MFS transporter [Chloroflexi bacterium]|nr:MFS transporter [Chloroflexota bacterium]
MRAGDVVAEAVARRRWLILIAAYFCILTFAITLQSVPPLLSLIMADLELSYAQGGLLMSLFALPGVIVSIPAGILADRYGQKVIAIVSFAFVIIGAAVFASGGSFAVLALGRVIAGVGAMVLMVLAPQFLAQWFAGRELGIAMGVSTTGMPVGTILSMNFLPLVAQSLGWRASAWLGVGASVVILGLFAWLFAPSPGRSRAKMLRSEGFFQGIRSAGAPIWIIGVAWMLFNAGAISQFSFTPSLLADSGFSVATAGFLASAVMFPPLVCSPTMGFIIDRIGRKRTIIAFGSLAMAALLFLIPNATAWILVPLLLVGVTQTTVPTPILSLPPEVMAPEKLGLGFGIIFAWCNLGILVGPALAGLARDISGSYQASYALMAGFIMLIAPTILILRWQECRLSKRQA